MSKTSRRLFDPITTQAELKAEIDRAGAWFIREYIDELADNFDQFRTKELKNQYMDYFYNDCFTGQGTKKDLQGKINTAIRIIESGLVEEAMEYVTSAAGCEGEAKDAAGALLESLASGATALPEFHR